MSNTTNSPIETISASILNEEDGIQQIKAKPEECSGTGVPVLSDQQHEDIEDIKVDAIYPKAIELAKACEIVPGLIEKLEYTLEILNENFGDAETRFNEEHAILRKAKGVCNTVTICLDEEECGTEWTVTDDAPGKDYDPTTYAEENGEGFADAEEDASERKEYYLERGFEVVVKR